MIEIFIGGSLEGEYLAPLGVYARHNVLEMASSFPAASIA